ncbi:PIG-L deacetylase family protein [Chryseobacterium potabilaquae]|uniref:N-acetyl-alpha-D-glucosaminyl L-malate deacetylase 1 n=1 Tax=Chryseobacterium potabilaquae TaxID=2675057 RepID=A0A6N4X534_9FLAO|nr:PIG-L deacetylase family protein [Chryseobacterium potabilaquae]CAA7193906.1 N-acetyl-alpha-D-glucosaminyl L-malate deacetylase 1 [Chryseobacterium potabilaquae]
MEIILVGNQSYTKKLSSIIKQELYLQSLQLSFENISSKDFRENSNQIFIIVARKTSFQPAINAFVYIKTHNPSAYIILLVEDKNMELMEAALEYGINSFWVLTTINEHSKEKLINKLRVLVQQKKTNRILAIGAHPDDVEIGCGGTILKHISKHDEVLILTLTKGAAGGDTEKRSLEAKAASEFMNVRLIISNLKDTSLSDGPKTIRVIEEVINSFQPDIIYTHSINDNHHDHRNAHLATIIAARKIDKVYAYQSPSTNINFRPQKFESIDNFIDLKLQLIALYESQTKKAVYLKDEVIRATATYWGRYSNYQSIEPFEIIKS